MATAPETITDATAAPADPNPAQQPQAENDISATDFYADDKPAEEAAPGAEGQAEEGADAQEDLTPIEAPGSWSKDYKEQFAALPRDMQEIISKRETERETFLQTKSREAAQTRQTVESEARQVLLQISRNHAQQLQQYASQFEVQQPDLRLLNSGDPSHRDLYFQQEAAYRHATAQRTQAQQEAAQAAQQAEQLEQHEQQLAIQQEITLLTEKVPEWSDPSERAKLLDTLQPIAAELGYSAEAMSQARAADIIALKTASEWKAKAAKLDQLMKQKMVPVRAAKQTPPAARPGSPSGQQPPSDPIRALYPNDMPRN